MTRLQDTLEAYEQSFVDAQTNFDKKLDTTDHSGLVLPGDIDSFDAERRVGEAKATSPFKPIDIHLGSLAATEALYVQRPLLVPNVIPGYGTVLSPAVITRKIDHHPRPGQRAQVAYFLTKIMQPFVPEVGVTEGMHLGISLATQSRAGKFGGHGDSGIASGFEQGHFLATAIGAYDTSVGQSIRSNGHSASGEVINQGIIDKISGGKMIAIPAQQTVELDTNHSGSLRLYWHEGLEPGGVPIFGDKVNALVLATGGALRALGEEGQERVKDLVDDAVREKKQGGHGSVHGH